MAKKATGRPAKGPQKRTRALTLLLSEDEYRVVQGAADRSHLSLAVWGRSTLLRIAEEVK